LGRTTIKFLESFTNTTGEASNKSEKESKSKGKGTQRSMKKPGSIIKDPVYSFSPDVSPEFQEQINEFTKGANDSLRAQLSRHSIGEDKSTPFASVREGEIINVVIPLTITRGDALAELIMLIASQLPTAVLIQGTEGWEEPQWTGESSRHLMGIVSAIQAPPDSFAMSSSPVDLARLAVWISACHSAISAPGGVEGTVDSVIPTEVGGAKSASKYLTKLFGALRAISSEKKHTQAIMTLERLLKLWYKEVREQSLALVRRNKISWGALVNKAAPTITKKIKGNMVTSIKSPSKPSRSPYLSGKEKQALSSILKPEWELIDKFRETWNALPAEEQHKHYGGFIKEIKRHFEDLNRISTSVHSKLGHRKKWIHKICEDLGCAPTKKKDKSNEFVWTQNFFKNSLTGINISIALVFAPSHFLIDEKYDGQNIVGRLFNRRDRQLTPADTTQTLCGATTALWVEWVTRFAPTPSVPIGEIPDAESISDENYYTALVDADNAP
jgi:hypothetical protein